MATDADQKERRSEPLSTHLTVENDKYLKSVRARLDEKRPCKHTITDALNFILGVCSNQINLEKVVKGA